MTYGSILSDLVILFFGSKGHQELEKNDERGMQYIEMNIDLRFEFIFRVLKTLDTFSVTRINSSIIVIM